MSATKSVMANIGTRMATPDRIASAIYGAVTDGTRRLRYLAGDDVKHFVDARRRLSDEEYENYVRAQLT